MIRFFIVQLLFSSLIVSQSLVINEIMSSNSSALQDEDGNYSDWLEVYNPTDTNINLTSFSLSDNPDEPRKWIFPNIDLGAGEYLLIFASGEDAIEEGNIHTNFKISAEGETLVLSDANSQILDQVNAPKIPKDVSHGRDIKNISEWLFYNIATPGAANKTEGFQGFAEIPIFSVEDGFYINSLTVVLSTTGNNIENIYFTLDGSEPTINSNNYSTPININKTTVLRAKSFATGLIPSKVVTKTYFINESSTLPVFSISTNPENFFDDEKGIYVVGTNGLFSTSCGITANYNQDWERPIHISMFQPNGEKNFGIKAGVKIHGGCYTSSFAQKSLRIKARSEYGSSNIPFQLFKDRPFKEYYSFLLRNSGNDWEGLTMMRDGMMQTLVRSLDLETQAYQPSIVFLNGEYWGIHNLRERIDKDYIAQYHNIGPENIDLMEGENTPVEGDAIHYDALYSFIQKNDLSIQANYDYVITQMEIDNYIDYMISQMYFNNRDWIPMNIKYWRPRTPDGKWRWILFDTDFGFGYNGTDEYNYNMFDIIRNPNKYFSAFINGLLENEGFKNKFINTFADYSNSIFNSSKVIKTIDSIQTLIEPEIPRHMTKYFGWYEFWYDKVEDLRLFAKNRIPAMQGHFISEFGLSGVADLNVDINIKGSGEINLNRINVKEFPWNGKYFQEVPITLEAIPHFGYEFVGWSGDVVSSERIIKYLPNETNEINALFRLEKQTYKVIINEINYFSNDDMDPSDWIEIYNYSEEDVDISQWKFSNDRFEFHIPAGTTLGKKNYLVFSEYVQQFKTVFPKVVNVVNKDLGFSFGGGGDKLSLYNESGILVNMVKYEDKAPWPSSPHGDGPTLELKTPSFNNDSAENWGASIVYGGTPGEMNSIFNMKPLVVINEINYNYGSCNWIELYNNSDYIIEVSNWELKDINDTLRFVLPQNSFIQPKDFLVVSRDANNFLSFFKDVNNLIQISDFDLKRESKLVRLINNYGVLIDSVRYDDEELWPISISGSFNSMELKHPDFDNSEYSNWSHSFNFGTPGKINSSIEITAVYEKEYLPYEFALSQNYPNPFNPSTTINFSLPIKTNVQLEVYNIIGEKVRELVNEELSMGSYDVEFNSLNLSSGIYIYKLRTSNFIETKKMILLR